MKKYKDMTETERAFHRARQLLAQPEELLNVRDLRLALQQLLDAVQDEPTPDAR